MACTDLTQPINRKEARAILAELTAIQDRLRPLIAQMQGNGHDDAPDYADDALSLLASAHDAIVYELDQTSSEAA